MTRKVLVPFVAANIALAIAVVSLSMMRGGGASPGKETLIPDQGWEGVVVPEFNLVDQDGREVDESILDGKVTILDFVFTNCPLQCPAMTYVLSQVAEQTQGSGVRFASMSIDPIRDTPAALTEHADQFGVDTGRWTMMTEPRSETGEYADVARHILKEQFQYQVADLVDEDPIELDGGATMPNIVHPGTYFLIGPDREVLGVYSYNSAELVEMMRTRAIAAAEYVAKNRR